MRGRCGRKIGHRVPQAGSSRRSFAARAAALWVVACVIPACGPGSRMEGSAGPGPAPSVLGVQLTSPSGVQNGIVSVPFVLQNSTGLTCTITVQFSTNGGATLLPATSGPAGSGTTGLAVSGTGTAYVFQWNSLADGVGLAGPVSVIIRITPADMVGGTPSTTATFTVDNSTHTPPSIAITTPVGTQSGLVPVAYFLSGPNGDYSSLTVWFSTNGGTTFSPATQGPGGDGRVNLALSVGGGTAHTYLWNSVADGVALGGANAQVQIKMQPSDGLTGASVSTPNFTVNNSLFSTGGSIGGAFPVQRDGTAMSDWAVSVAADAASLYVLGFEGFNEGASAGADSSWRLEKRSLATGALVAGFGSGGAVAENPGPGLDIPFRVLVDGGTLYLIGAQESALGSHVFTVRVEMRAAADGSLIASFGASGVLLGPGAAGFDGIPLTWGAAVDGSFLYLAGSVTATSASDVGWHIEKRDKLTGMLVSSFGVGGKVDENPTALADGCFGITIDATSMWLVGTQGIDGEAASNSQIRVEKRRLLDGSLVSAFGTGGVLSLDAGPGDDLAEDVVRDSTSLYVYSRVETGFSSGVFSNRIDKLSLVDGTAGVAAVTGGAHDPSGDLPCGHLAQDGTNLYVCSADGTADCQWRIEKRLMADLSLVGSFGTSGVLGINPSVGGYDRPLAIAAAGGVLYLSGMDEVPGEDEWRLEARWR